MIPPYVVSKVEIAIQEKLENTVKSRCPTFSAKVIEKIS